MKRLLVLSLFLALAAALFWLGRQALGVGVGTAGLAIAAGIMAALAVRWVLVLRRRQRQKLEDMRDSALW